MVRLKSVLIITVSVILVLFLNPVFTEYVFATHVSNEHWNSHCQLGDTWNQIDDCFANARLHNLQSELMPILIVLGGIVFVLLVVWIMLRRFKSSLIKNTKNKHKQDTVNTGNSFCGNCGNSANQDIFCSKCGSKINP